MSLAFEADCSMEEECPELARSKQCPSEKQSEPPLAKLLHPHSQDGLSLSGLKAFSLFYDNRSLCSNFDTPFLGNPEQKAFESTRKIGPLTVRQRFEKIERYLRKKQFRRFQKKISYDCRKVIAERRVREQGRFVAKNQAIRLLELKQEELKPGEA